ncbi:MAG: flavodoxin family protein [Candidatus Azobacteroides sp.]|nr:flavodoxin family protein [Candidatus Azobacteroides sp.]
MKVIGINGSPHKEGNTYYALSLVGESLREEGINFDIIQVGEKPIRGCIGCNMCFRNRNGRCIITNDALNSILHEIKDVDGLILGSPVYYSGIAGTMKCFLDRAFYVANANGRWFRHKVGASVVAVRRSGGSMTLDSLNYYLTITEMLIPSSNYWNIIHGHQPGEAGQDEEGKQVMNILGKNMAWMLKMKDAVKPLVKAPEPEDKIVTNFIR